MFVLFDESPYEDWRTLPSRLDDPSGRNLLTRRQSRAWSLVLEARHCPFYLKRAGLHWQILVPPSKYKTALEELRHYEQENRNWPPSPPPTAPLIDNRITTLGVLIAIGLFHDLTLHQFNILGHSPVNWSTLGGAHAGKIMDGEFWRLVTSLTLHADGLHLMGNLVIGGLFVIRLCRDLGSGLGWSLLLAAGASGNLVNAWLQSPDHRAVGASTAIFGAVGLLGAISMVRYRHSLRLSRRWLLPFAGAIGLLAMLGVGGETTDLGAHLWGFLFGLLYGMMVELVIERYGRASRTLNLCLSIACIACVSVCWWMALAWSNLSVR